MKSTFFCVQPIDIETTNLLEIFNCNINEKKLKEYSSTLPTWIANLKSINNISYENTVSLSLPDIYTKKLKSNMDPVLAELVDEENTSFYLLFDTKLAYFNLCFEIKLDYSSLSEEEMEESPEA